MEVRAADSSRSNLDKDALTLWCRNIEYDNGSMMAANGTHEAILEDPRGPGYQRD
jgi:hypothetical protein